MSDTPMKSEVHDLANEVYKLAQMVERMLSNKTETDDITRAGSVASKAHKIFNSTA